MPASYPSSAKTFSTKSNGNTIDASHVNDLQLEVAAVEGGLLSGLAHVVKPLTDAAYDLGTSLLRWTNLYLSGVLFNADGAVGAPSYSFKDDTNTGVWRAGADTLSFSTAGVKAMEIDATNFIDSATQPRCQVYNNASQAVATGAAGAAITFNSEDFDVGGLHDTGANTSRITIPTGGDGLYLFIANTSFAANATGTRQLYFRKNGAGQMGTYSQVPASSAADLVSLHNSIIAPLVAGDYVEMIAVQTSGGNLNVGHATRIASSQLSCVKLW